MTTPSWFKKTEYLESKLAQLIASGDTSYTNIVQVDAAIEAAGLTAYEHFTTYGSQERTSPNKYFQATEYLAAKAIQMNGLIGSSGDWTADKVALEIKEAGLTIWDHFQQYGWNEGVNPSNSFDVSSYLDAKLEQLKVSEPDAGWTLDKLKDVFKELGLSPISHYFEYGQGEFVPVQPVPADEQVPSAGGDSFTLTTGADTPATTDGNDVITALTIDAAGNNATTFSAFDNIDGKGGNDTLNIYTDNANNLNNAFPTTIAVKNVETINILNAGGVATVFGDASRFEGVTALNQVGSAANVTNLADTTTAGFKDVTADATANLTVGTVATATSASVYLDGVKGNTTTNDVELGVSGAALNSVKVAGTVAQTDAAATDPAAFLALKVTGSTTATAFNLNTAVNTTLTLASMAAVNTIDASASTGGLTYVGGTGISTIKTGSGADKVTVATTTTATVGALVETGAGNDEITVSTTGPGATKVNAGAGDDKVIVTNINNVSTSSVIDGGEGNDILSTAVTTLVNEQYTLLGEVFKNFETLEFTTTAASFDASRLASYSSFDLKAGGTVTKVADAQAVATSDTLTVTANGYDASGATTVYAGALKVAADAGTFTVTANAKSVDLAVKASATADAIVTLAGDVQSANVVINSAFDATGAYVKGASVTAATVDTTGLDALTTITLSGTGSATVTNGADTALVTINASGLAGADTNADGIVNTGLTYETSNVLAETISLGSGKDLVTINTGASTVAATDTVTGFTLVALAGGGLDVARSDALTFEAGTYTAIGAVTASSLALALVDVAAHADAANGIVFAFGGDTYAFKDTVAGGAVDDGDALIKLTGAIDQALLVADLIS